jgi:alpha-mannosidase
MKKLKAYVVNHGHMDIEWYQPLTVFGEWFCQSIDMLEKIAENEPDYKCYVYDGVVFPVLYAMEKDERLKEKVRKLLDSKKLRLGPFYTQFDEFLACGESIIKNCLWGDRLCRELAASPMKAGYLLDNFGHPAQLSQILNNFKIKSLFFSRGMCDVGDNVKEFLFCSPDGSQVVAQNFSYGSSFKIYENNSPIPGNPNLMPYYNKGTYGYGTYEYLCDLSKHIDHKGIAEQLIEGVKNAARFYPTGIIPLFVGADHCPPQEGITKTLKLANEMQDEIEFIFSDAEELSELLSKEATALPRHNGDLLGSKFDRLLFGATTTRIYLKQDMYNSEHLLFAYALPLKTYDKKLG